MSDGNSKTQVNDWINNFNPRILGLAAKKGTLFRYIPVVGAPLQLLKNDDGFSTNWTAAGDGSSGSIYRVGSGDLVTIQEAIDLAYAEGSSIGGKRATIYVPPGTYTENLVFRPGQSILGQTALLGVGAVNVIGQHIFTPPPNPDPLANGVIIQSITFVDLNAGNTITFDGTEGAICNIFSCSFTKDVSGHCFYAINTNGIAVMSQCSTSSYTSNDSFIYSTSPVTVANLNTYVGGTTGPFIEYFGTAFCQINLNSVQCVAPFAVAILAGNAVGDYNNFTNFQPDSDCVRVGAGVNLTMTHCTFNCPTGTGYVLQGTGTFSGSMLVYPDNNVKDPGLTFNLLSSDP